MILIGRGLDLKKEKQETRKTGGQGRGGRPRGLRPKRRLKAKDWRRTESKPLLQDIVRFSGCGRQGPPGKGQKKSEYDFR